MADEARKRTKPWAVQLYDFIVGEPKPKPKPAPKPAVAKPKLREKAIQHRRPPTQPVHKGTRKMMKEVEF